MFREVVGAVVGSGPPVIFELLLGLAIAKPVEKHVHGFRAARLDVVVDVLLSVSIGVLGCLWPISSRSWRMGTASRALM